MAKKASAQDVYIRDFIDLVAPGVIKFEQDMYILGNTFRCCWAIKDYPSSTKQQALLCRLGEKDGVTLKIYTRPVSMLEEKKLYQEADRSTKFNQNSASDIRQSVIAQQNLQDLAESAAQANRNHEPLLECAVFIELIAGTPQELANLQKLVEGELSGVKVNVDKLYLKQKEGFLSVMPSGFNRFGAQHGRYMPASSAANLYPLSYSGQTDRHGFVIGRAHSGSNVLADLDYKSADRTNGNVLILGNSGEGKSFLLKNLLYILRAAGKDVISLDCEAEYEDLTVNLGGSYIDLMSGKCLINVLEPKSSSDSEKKVSTHIGFMRDFFCSYNSFDEREADVIEKILLRLYQRFKIDDDTDLSKLKPKDYPILSDYHRLLDEEFNARKDGKQEYYTAEMLADVCLGLEGICRGVDSHLFNGYTQIQDSHFITFGLKGVLGDAKENLKDAILFNLLSYMSGALLTKGNTVAAVDEMYLLLSNLSAVTYLRNFMKRVRKKNSNVIVASQNIGDFFQPEIMELTKPLFSIPTHHFLFYPGIVDKDAFMDALQLRENEYNLIREPNQGNCLYRCGLQRYYLEVVAPPHRRELFGTAGGVGKNG